MEKGFQLRNYHIRRGSRPKDSTPIYPITKAENVIGGAGGVTRVTELPATGEEGKIYYNTTDKKYYLYDGTSYSPIGSTGANGKSAYDIAVDEGFDGDETTWLASLKGDKGDKGDTGNAGPKGDKGDTGATGTQGPAGADGADGSTPHIDALTGNWFIGDTDTQVKAQGPKGDSGVASGDGVVVVNDTSGEPAEITEGQVAVLGAGVGKYIADRAIPTSGTFADAYDKARANSSVVFPWMLIDEDESGEPVKKMIWHVGNREFIDAIGAEITGKKNGITINVSAPCRMILNEKTFSLPTGETNISFEEVGASYAPQPSFLMPESDESAKSLVESIDFGGFDIIGRNASYYPLDSIMTNFPNITRIERLSIGVNNPNSWQNSPTYWMDDNDDKLEFLSLVGTKSVIKMDSCFSRLAKLSKVDFSQMHFTISSSSNSNGILSVFSEDPMLEEVDISGWDTSGVKNFFQAFMNCRALKKLTIGNFSNASMASKDRAFLNVADCVLVCTTPIPPVLKNCAFNGETALDEYSNTYDWVAGHFSAIYVPSESANDYKTNTYIENGTVGNTGWSKYADIIHPITEYNE